MVFGAGYVGGEIARHAVAAGAKVTCLTRNPDRATSLTAAGCQVVTADLAENDWHDKVAPADHVLDCVGSGGGGLEGYRKSYLEGMESILLWAGHHSRPGHLVYTSSTSVYPQGDGQSVTETSPTAGAHPAAEVLLQTEDRVGRWPGEHTILRLAGIYGPGRHHLLDQLQAGADELPGRPGHHLNLAYRDDIVDAVFATWTQPETAHRQVFNVADDSPVSREEVVTWLCMRLGRSLPTFTGQVAVGRRRVTPDRRIANTKLKSVLDWRPAHPSYREGYASILAALPDTSD